VHAATSTHDVMILAGTRPEGVKVAPLVRELRRDTEFSATLVDTGQHAGRVGEALAPFDVAPDVVLRLRRPAGTLPELGAVLMTATDRVLTRHRPAAVVVQGDTLTATISGMVAFWHQIPVIHLEAGLRTHDLARPFPEEANRAMLARFASLHLAPTATARGHLLAEGIPDADIVVTGNTVVDALWYLLDAGLAAPPSFVDPNRRTVVVTAHRRENWGPGLANVCAALRRLAEAEPDLQIVMVAHPNPALSAALRPLLGDIPAVRFTPPLGYQQMIGLLDAASLVITDSGGLQEEAASLGVPLVVTRETTERPEAVSTGAGVLVGTDPDRIVAAATSYLRLARRTGRDSPFGDGHAAQRSVEAIRMLFATPTRELLAPV
jgi:UDP-N-acetylglucosamine 2-epimerase (non-hydrolysing)